MTVYAWLIDLIHRRKNCPTGMISGGSKKRPITAGQYSNCFFWIGLEKKVCRGWECSPKRDSWRSCSRWGSWRKRDTKCPARAPRQTYCRRAVPETAATPQRKGWQWPSTFGESIKDTQNSRNFFLKNQTRNSRVFHSMNSQRSLPSTPLHFKVSFIGIFVVISGR